MILNKLSKLKAYLLGNKADQEDISLVESWEAEAKKLFLLHSLKSHEGVKYVLEMFNRDIESINNSLLFSSSKELPDRERDRLLDKREFAQKFVNLFKVESEIERLEQNVEAEISSNNQIMV